MRWLRLYHETPSDPKLRRIAHCAGTTVGHVLAVWVSMMCHASEQPAEHRGTLQGWDDTDCAINLGIDPAIVFAIRKEMEARLLDGKKLIAWDKRQYDSDSAAARTKKWRDRKNQQNQSSGDAVTACDVTVTAKSRLEERREEISYPSDTPPKAAPLGMATVQKVSRKAKPPSAEVEFDAFWAKYPRKEGKGYARKAWPKAVVAAGGAQEILDGLTVALSLGRFDMREGGRFCPHPSSWLNAERWLDGLEPEPNTQLNLSDMRH